MNDAGRGDGGKMEGPIRDNPSAERPDFIHRHKRLFATAFVLSAGAMLPWSGGAFRYVDGALAPAMVEGSDIAPDPVIDPAGLFDDEQAARLTQELEESRQRTGVHFAIITTRGLRGETVKDFTNRYHNGWYRSGNDQPAVIVLFAPADRKLGISNSKSIGPAIDPWRDMIIANMVPLARRGDFEAAAMMAIEQMEGRLARPAATDT